MKTIFATTLAAAALVAAPALAQNVSRGNTLTYGLDADVGAVCGVYSTSGQTVAVAFGDLAELTSTQSVVRDAEAVYRCNTTTGFSREIKSLNNGVLVRQGSDGLGSDRISYRFSHGGTNNLAVSSGRPLPLSTPVTSDHAGSGAFLTGVVAPLSFQISGVFNNRGGYANGAPGTTVFAGDYTDTVTITVNAK